MNEDRIFLDTNVLVYAYDRTAGKKHHVAKNVVLDLWNTGNGVISTQVLQEFFVTVTRKIPNPLRAIDAKSIVVDFLKWTVAVSTGDVILDAIDLHLKHRFTFWDSMILASALAENCELLYSEDLQHGLVMEGITIKNPFQLSA